MDISGQLVCGALCAALLAAPAARAETRRIDPERTTIAFTQPYMGLMKVTGQFSGVTGEISETEDGRMGLNIRIPVGSVQTGSKRVNAYLTGRGFFAAKEFPEATFVSDDVVRGDNGELLVKGTMILRGVRQPISFTADPIGDDGDGFTAMITLSRSAFGVGRGAIGVPDRITLQVTAVSAKTDVSEAPVPGPF